MSYFVHKLHEFYLESYKEVNIDCDSVDQSYAIYPKRFYKSIDLGRKKTIDFTFIGALSFGVAQTVGYNNRKWIIDFAKTHFNENSLFINTTKNLNLNHSWEVVGPFDKTFSSKTQFMCPKIMMREDRNNFDKAYFDNLSESKFCLCPAGDLMWSMRFYECLMCKCIPIVDKVDETFRSPEESKLEYKYYTTSSPEFIYREDWVEHNYNIFLKYHTLEFVAQ